MSFFLWTVMNALAEMTTYLPITGTSVPLYINRFFDPSLAFASGWNYWYAYAMLISAEVSAAAVVIGYWTTSVPVAVWISIILVLIVCLNIFVVSLYGESEFWFASIKILAILGLIILGIVLFAGGGPDHHELAFTVCPFPFESLDLFSHSFSTGPTLARSKSTPQLETLESSWPSGLRWSDPDLLSFSHPSLLRLRPARVRHLEGTFQKPVADSSIV